MTNIETSSMVTPPWHALKVYGYLARSLRNLEVGKDVTFPAEAYKLSTVRASVNTVSNDFDRKFQIHKYEDGSIGVWREK